MPPDTFVIRDGAWEASRHAARAAAAQMRRRTLVALCCVLACFAAIGGQLVRLAFKHEPEILKVMLAEPLAQSWSRPDIVDRQGRLLATDVAVHSLYADPQLILDLDEAMEKLSVTLPGFDADDLRKSLGDKSRRFVWVARNLSPRQAQRVHALGLPGFAFRTERKRAYPLGSLAGHILGTVNIDNKGIAGVERMLDETGRVEALQGAGRTLESPVRLSIDIGVQHALAEELNSAMTRYGATAVAGVVLKAATGEIIAAVSLPGADPARPADWLDAARADRLTGGVYELGSIFKTLTVAMALEYGLASLDTVYDVRQPLSAGPYAVKDLNPQGRPLSVREIFLHSSNVGAGMLALATGAERQRAFLARLGLLQPLRTEAGLVAPPLLPKNWGKAETVTIGYGHGLAVAPLQFAATTTALVNGGDLIAPTFMARNAGTARRQRVVSAATSSSLREALRLNVTSTAGTGRRAEAEGYRVGGKTGTAEMPGRGGYQEKAVISSFIGAFPMDAPQYVMLVLLFEPQPVESTGDRITAGRNAAPTTARIVERIAPLLGVLPRLVATRSPEASPFDAPPGAQ
jgi:cell division protein FtsI (penicillin-binding protein 3)